MNLRFDWPDATAVHGALAPAATLLLERRALYRMAHELFSPQAPELSDDEVDNPLFRYRIGEALAGRIPFGASQHDDLAGLTSHLVAGPARLRLVRGGDANTRLAGAMRVVHAQSGAAGAPARLLTEGDADFAEARAIAEAGLRKAWDVSPRLIGDLLPHTSLLAILDPATSGGLVSASSRLFPGLILIDRPTCPYDVAEALVHEGAHQKFFDLAITREFLGADHAQDRIFRPSWSGARWPVEQVIAAFHAYACLAQFGADVAARSETGQLGSASLLGAARAREAEIGAWLLRSEDALGADARWFLRSFLREQIEPPRCAEIAQLDGRYELVPPLLRVARMAASGRALLAHAGERQDDPPRLLWLEREAADIVDALTTAPQWFGALGADRARALAGLVESSLVRRIADTRM